MYENTLYSKNEILHQAFTTMEKILPLLKEFMVKQN